MKEKPIPAVAYYRMSTDKQEESIPRQMSEVRKYAAEHGFNLIREYDKDARISGGSLERDDWKRMKDDALRGDFEHILVWKLDRFSRWDQDDFWAECRPLIKAGVRLVSVVEGGEQDWFTTKGKLLMSIHVFGAANARPYISISTGNGMARQAREGWWLGSPPYGYRCVRTTPQEVLAQDKHAKKRSRLEVILEQAEIVKEIFRRYAYSGMSARALAAELNRRPVPTFATIRGKKKTFWRASTVLNILRCEAYLGHTVWNKTNRSEFHVITKGGAAPRPRAAKKCQAVPPEDQERKENTHEPLIDVHTWETAKARLEGRYRPRAPKDGQPYLFTGMIRCGVCGALMHGRTPPRVGAGKVRCEERQYVCSGGNLNGSAVCRCRRVFERDIVKALATHADATLTEASDREAIVRRMRGLCDGSPKEADRLRVDLDKLDANIAMNEERILDAPADVYPGLLAALRRRKEERTALAERLKAAEETAQAFKDADRAADVVSRAAKNLRATLRLHAWAGNPEVGAIFRGLYQSVRVDFEDVVVVNRVKCIRNRPGYKGPSRSKVTGFRIDPRPEAFTPKGLAALVSGTGAPNSGTHARRLRYPVRLQSVGQRQDARRLPEDHPRAVRRRAGARLGVGPLNCLPHRHRDRRLAPRTGQRSRPELPDRGGSANHR
jgi:DNA invertase Pin-like site-specific DNA recombinase